MKNVIIVALVVVSLVLGGIHVLSNNVLKRHGVTIDRLRDRAERFERESERWQRESESWKDLHYQWRKVENVKREIRSLEDNPDGYDIGSYRATQKHLERAQEKLRVLATDLGLY